MDIWALRCSQDDGEVTLTRVGDAGIRMRVTRDRDIVTVIMTPAEAEDLTRFLNKMLEFAFTEEAE
jgi:uncharacterized beta-barrel protein YwiB (DUF1934 family)